MSGILVKLLFISGILSNSEAISHDTAPVAANVLVGSHLDYCNSLFRSVSTFDLHWLQCVQNTLARIVANTSKYSHITPVKKESSLVAYQALLCFQDGPVGVQVST